MKLTTSFAFQVFLPLVPPKTVDGKPAHNFILAVNNLIECPAHDTDVVVVGANSGQIIRTIAIVAVNGIVPLDVFQLSPYTVNYFAIFFADIVSLGGKTVVEPNCGG